jgi:uncharacterized membrane protein YgdD (TMEM256/DUF423 family)
MLLIALALLVIGIVFGAFAAHTLNAYLIPKKLESFNTAVRYQTWQAFGLILMLVVNRVFQLNLRHIAFVLLLTGTLLFSVSIYLLVLTNEPGVYRMILGPLTPIGGLIMIIAWLWFFIHILRLKVSK